MSLSSSRIESSKPDLKQPEATKSVKVTHFSQIDEVKEESPLKQSAREIINELKDFRTASSPAKSVQDSQVNADDERLMSLESKLMALIQEQESEVLRLQQENERVAYLQEEC